MAYATINKPTDYFNTVLYTGNGTNAHGITGVGFQPDWVWLKSRSESEHHTINDSVRGANKQLYPHLTYGEATDTDRLQSFDSDGFTLGTDVVVNKSSQTFVSWNWLASNTTASNTDGSITSTVSVNTTSGFSIVSYTGNATTGATIGHGLGVTPDVIIAKSRASTDNWGFFHSSFSSQDYMFLNTQSAKASASSVWNALPSSSVFTVGDNASVNDNGNMIAYCFVEKKGFSKFGSYTGSGSTNFIYTGFKPAFFLVKNTSDGSQDWFIYDNKRDPYNLMQTRLRPNQNTADTTNPAYYMDFLSNGFCLKTGNTGFNGSGDNFIYMAFAENPLVGTNNIPATAR